MAAPLVIRRPLAAACVLVLGFAALATPAARLRPDNDLHAWLPDGDAAQVTYARFQRDFGGDDAVVLATSSRDRAALPAALAQLEDRVRALPGVERVLAPVARDPDGGLRLSVELPFTRALLSDDAAGLLVTLAPRSAEHDPAVTLARLEELATHAAGGPFESAGPVVIHGALDRASRSSFESLLPAAALGVLWVLMVGLANVRAAAAILITSGAAAAATLGIVATAGRPLHMVLSVLPAMLVVVGTGYALHPLVRYLDDPVVPGEDDGSRLGRVLTATRRPALVAALTTAAGFLSLLTADLRPVRDLGLFGAIGVLVAFGAAYSLAPALVRLLRVRPYGPRRDTPRAAGRTSGPARGGVARSVAAAAAHPVRALAAWTLVLFVAAAGAARVRVESNVMRLLPDAAPVRTATTDIEDRLLGLTPLEIRLDGPSDAVLGPRVTAAVAQLSEELAGLPLVTHVLSPYEVVGPDVPAASLPALLPSHARRDGDRASTRLTVCSRTVASDASRALGDDVEQRATAALAPLGVTAVVTGAVPLLAGMQVALVHAQILSFAGAFVLVSLALLIDLRSWRLAALAIVPNVAPVIVAAGVLGWTGAPLDAATVAVAGVAFGLAVDDTVHVLHRWRVGGVSSIDRSSARAIVLTTCAAVCGFAGFAVSDFPPAARFGLLVACSAAVALAADLLLLPALLVLAAPRGAATTRPAGAATEVTP